MHTGEECFLARSEWRDIERAPIEATAYGSEATQLKNVMSNLMLDFPDVIREAADLVVAYRSKRGRKDYEQCVEDSIYQQQQLKLKLETWFATVSLKTAPEEGAHDGQTNAAKQRYRNLFCGIVDCIINSVLVKLDRMLFCLRTLLHPTAEEAEDLGWGPDFLKAIEKRGVNARAAFAFVKSTSDIGTKPLDFGLKVIATDDDLFEVPVPTKSGQVGIASAAHFEYQRT